MAVPQPTVQIAERTNGEGTQRVGHLQVRLKPLGAEVIDDVPSDGDECHHGHLLPLPLVDDGQEDHKGCHEGEALQVRIIADQLAGAGRVGIGVCVHQAVDRCADGDAVA